jgi:protocatechuate 4,5-dioxygenase alpha chain
MSKKIPFNLEPPGTYMYTGELSTRGYQLNKFCLSLKDSENRQTFKQDEEAYLACWELPDKQKQLIRDRDWTGLMVEGGHLLAILKIAVTQGENHWEIGAHNAGYDVEEMKTICPRHVHGLPPGIK